MSREIDYDNLVPEDIAYLRDRESFMRQPTAEELAAMYEREGIEGDDDDNFVPAEQTEGDDNDDSEPVEQTEPDEEPIIEEPEDDGLDKLTVAELKKRLKKAKLPVSGNHGELVARLRGSSWT
jgi:hypothetical protein